jgi:predicted nuclease of predicted toxin-antitoxin system
VTLWLNNQRPPTLATWMRSTLPVDCIPIRDMNLHRASDHEIFVAARDAQVVVMTKVADFVALVDQHGAPPHVILVTCGKHLECAPLSSDRDSVAYNSGRPRA